MANPRVTEYVTGADALFAHHATVLGYDDFCAVLRQWEFYADVDGADQGAEQSHRNRNASLAESAIDGSWTLQAGYGAMQGAAMGEIFDRYEQAELLADWADARERLGEGARIEDLDRTPAQRRADALFEIFRRAGGASVTDRSPEPLVTIVVDQRSFEDELRRAAGEEVHVDPDTDLDGRCCQTLDGSPLRPSEVVAAALIGHVRRVVTDAAGTVIDLGRRRRLFTGSARDAALLQAFLRPPGGLRCLWSGCHGRGRNLQVDHRHPASRGGPTDTANAEAFCGFHNRIKERGFRPVRNLDGTWTIHRPDGSPTTPPA